MSVNVTYRTQTPPWFVSSRFATGTAVSDGRTLKTPRCVETLVIVPDKVITGDGEELVNDIRSQGKVRVVTLLPLP